jgi:hypothetical protein
LQNINAEGQAAFQAGSYRDEYSISSEGIGANRNNLAFFPK